MRYLGRRLIHAVFLLTGVSMLSFAFMALAPGDFFGEMRLNPQIQPETVTALRAQYGLDRSLPVRYAKWVKSVMKGDLGFSFAYDAPAAPLLKARARNTLALTLVATLLAWLIAVPLGVWSASRQGSWIDSLVGSGTSVLLAIPDLLLALGLLWFAVRTGWFPTGGMVSPGFAGLGLGAKARDIALHMALPVTALVLGTLPVLVRHVRAAVVEVLDAPFMLAARAHGIRQRRLLYRYALRAAANPLTTLMGFSIATLLSASLLVEVIMSWPGIGPLLLEAVLARDLYVVVGAVIFSTTFLVAGNLVADGLLYICDPRIRTQGVAGD
jgi:peptide/nickel transport system permease protein